MAMGTAYFSGKITCGEFKEFENGKGILTINLTMVVPGYQDAPATEETLQLSAYGQRAQILRRKLADDGHNYAMVQADVRCRPFIGKDGSTRAFPSFSIREICTERRNFGVQSAPRFGGEPADEIPF
jgi:hypothetical protein